MRFFAVSDGSVYKEDGEYYSADTYLDFLEEICKNFSATTLCIPVSQGRVGNKIFKDFQEDRLKIIETFQYRTVINFYKNLPLVLIGNFFTFLREIKKSEVVFLRLPAMNGFLIALLAFIYKKPVISYLVGDEYEIIRTGNSYKGLQFKIALAVSRLHTFICRKIISFSKVSFFLSTELKSKFSVGKESDFFVFTSLVEESGITINKEISTLSDTLQMLYVGRLSYEKGLEYVIHAVQHLVRDNISVKLLICGEGPERNKLETLVCEMGLSNYVEFCGFISWGDKLSDMYLSSDVFVLPSLSEGVPKVLLEAMSKGLPVIATSVGGIPDIIKNMDNGMLVSSKSSEEIVKSVKTLIENSTLREKLINNGYEFAKEHTLKKQAIKISKIIHDHLEHA